MRIKQVDGLRGIAVIIVLLFHFLNNSYSNSNELNGFEMIISKITSFGWAGVNLFFVISGFLIGTILLRNKSKKNYFSTFYKRRFLRILPLYFVFLFSYLLTKFLIDNNSLQIFKNPIPIMEYFLLVQNFAMSRLGRFGSGALIPTWSLAIEEQFYLIIPVLIYLLNKNYLLYLSILMIGFSFWFRLNSNNWYMEYTHFVSRMDSLFMGIIVAVLDSERYFNINKLKLLFIYLLGLFFIIVIFVFVKQINHTLISFCCGGVLLFLIKSDNIKSLFFRFVANKVTFFFGKYSYFIYLFHQLINGLIFGLLFRKDPMLNSYIDYSVEVFSLLCTLFIAMLSYKYFESIFNKIGQKYEY